MIQQCKDAERDMCSVHGDSTLKQVAAIGLTFVVPLVAKTLAAQCYFPSIGDGN